MRSKIFLIILIALIGESTNYLSAQSAGVNLLLGFPMNEFKDNVKRTGLGAGLQFLLWNPIREYPYTFGINISYINYGWGSRSEPFSSTVPDVVVNVDRTNNIINFHLMSQIMPIQGNVRPYLELLLGGSYIYTQTNVYSSGSEDAASSTNFSDWAWNYGAGGGFQIKLVSFNNTVEKAASVFLDFKVRYLNGTAAEYLKEGSVIINHDQVIYQVSKSKTDLLTVNLGAVVYFNHLFGGE